MKIVKRLFLWIIIGGIIYLLYLYVWPIAEDLISGNGGISIDLSSIPFIGERLGEPPPKPTEPGPPSPGETPSPGEVQVIPIDQTPPAPQPTPPPLPTQVPLPPKPTEPPVTIGEIVDTSVETSVQTLQGVQTVAREAGQTREALDEATGFPLCKGGLILLLILIGSKVGLGILRGAADRLFAEAESWVTAKALTGVGLILATFGTLVFQVYNSYETQGFSYVNSTILSIIPWAVLMIIWEWLLHRGIWEKIRFEIGGIRPLIIFSRAVEILLTGVYAVGGGLDLMVQIGQGIANWPIVGSILSPSIVDIAQSQSQARAAVSAQGWFLSTAATDALIGFLVICILAFLVMGGGFYGGGYAGPPGGGGEVALDRPTAAKGLLGKKNRG